MFNGYSTTTTKSINYSISSTCIRHRSNSYDQQHFLFLVFFFVFFSFEELIQIVFILSPQILNQGKTIRVAKGNRLNNEQIRNVFNENKQIRIEIGNEDLQRGKIIVIENNQIEFFDCEQYEKQQKHNLTDNPFFKRDFLQSKGQMEISIRISPDFFLQGQTVSFAKEDPQMIAANFPYRRQSRPSLPINNDLNSLN